MKRVKKTIRSLAMMALILAMLTSAVFAAGNGSVWLNAQDSSTEKVTNAWIVTNTVVTDGLVELTFDSDALTYQDIEVNEDYVAVYAVNARQPGVVKISWVAPGSHETEDALWLVKVTFAGEGTIALSGAVNGGEEVVLATLDTSELEKVILEAEGLYQDDYTPKSYDALKKALTAAKDVLADPTATQSEVDAAAEALRDAISSLELKKFTNNAELYKAILRAKGLCADRYTAESYAAVQEALDNALAVMNNPKATQKQVDEATRALNEAMENLELKQCANTSALKEAIAKAEALDANKYTPESYAAVEAALKDAKKVLADENASQEEVDEACDALNDAMDALVEKSAEESTEPSEPDEPSHGGVGSIIELIRKIIRGWLGWGR